MDSQQDEEDLSYQLKDIVPDNPRQVYDVMKAINCIIDKAKYYL